MKTKIAYLFAGFLTVTLLSCSDDSDLLIQQEALVVQQELVMQEEEKQSDSEEESVPILDYQTVLDAQRAVRPSSSQQMDGEQPDKKGQKGRDHRDWYDTFENSRIKDFEKDITQLELGDLYAIDPDGVNKYIFKFYFPEEYREYAKKYEGKRVVVSLYYRTGWSSGMFIQELFRTDSFSLDDSFLVARYDWEHSYYYGWNNTYCGYIIEYSFGVSDDSSRRETTFNDLLIIKEWH